MDSPFFPSLATFMCLLYKFTFITISALQLNPPVATGVNQTPGITVNGMVRPAKQGEADLGAEINHAQATCLGGCTITVPAGIYRLTTPITITSPNVRLIGNGATIQGTPSADVLISLTANNDELTGFSIDTNGSTYGILSSFGSNQHIFHNRFSGEGSIYLAISNSPSGAQVYDNDFNGTFGCGSVNNIKVFNSAQFDIFNNTMENTCGFAITTAASNYGKIYNNTIRQATYTTSTATTAGKTQYTVTWPLHQPQMSRVWIELDGHALSTGVHVALPNATLTMITLPTLPKAGSTLTALGFRALENIQINSMSHDISIVNNSIQGSGDAGIDVVSDYKQYVKGRVSARSNQTTYTYQASSFSGSALVVVNGLALSQNEAVVSHNGHEYTVTLRNMPPPGTEIQLIDFTMHPYPSQTSDYPSNITIANNTVKDTASSCIAAEIPAANIIIQKNLIENCGLGVDTPAYSSGIFTGSADPIEVTDNTIRNRRTIPSMRSAVSVQAPGAETGKLDKSIRIGRNTAYGTYSNGALYIPGFNPRQSGIDIVGGVTNLYPERPQLNLLRDQISVDTPYFRYGRQNISAHAIDSLVIQADTNAITLFPGQQLTLAPRDVSFFHNSIMKVFFWAKRNSDTPYVRLLSQFNQSTVDTSVAVTSQNWKRYSIYLSTRDIDPNTISLCIDSSKGSMQIRDILFYATPLGTE